MQGVFALTCKLFSMDLHRVLMGKNENRARHQKYPLNGTDIMEVEKSLNKAYSPGYLLIRKKIFKLLREGQ